MESALAPAELMVVCATKGDLGERNLAIRLRKLADMAAGDIDLSTVG